MFFNGCHFYYKARTLFFTLNSFLCASRMVQHPKNSQPNWQLWEALESTWASIPVEWGWQIEAVLRANVWGVQLNIRKVFLMFGILSVYHNIHWPRINRCRDLLPFSHKSISEVGHWCWAIRPGFGGCYSSKRGTNSMWMPIILEWYVQWAGVHKLLVM